MRTCRVRSSAMTSHSLSDGEAISSSEYLENALRSKGNKDISKAILECFMDRDCYTLVTPHSRGGSSVVGADSTYGQ